MNEMNSKITTTVKIDFTVSEPELVPTLGSDGAAAYDLRASEDGVIHSGETLLIRTGVKVAIPKGYVGEVCSRSGLALKFGVFVLNAPGLVDSDYRGEVGVVLHKTFSVNPDPFVISKGDRIAQLMFKKVADTVLIEVDSLDATDRGEGGFGSTGQQ